MLLKYDSSFAFQWVRNREHATFDYVNKIGLHEGKVFWSLVEYQQGSNVTRKLISFSVAGAPEDSIQSAVSGAGGGRPAFSMNSGGTGLLAYNIGPRFVFKLVDSALNTIWKDSTNLVGNLDAYPIAADFSGGKMVVSAAHNADTLRLAGIALSNPNTGGQLINNDVFIACWKVPLAVSVLQWRTTTGTLAEIYPNPATDFLWLKNVSSSAKVVCLDAAGRQVFDQTGAAALSVQALPTGLYLLRMVQNGREQVLRFEKE